MFYSCNDANIKSISIESATDKSLFINNNSYDELCFQIYINGVNPFSLLGCYKLSGQSTNDTDSTQIILDIFTFVCEYTWHKNIRSQSNNIYNPVIGISSLGGGLCNVRSGVLTNLLRMNGFNAYSIVLEGHVITVVNVDGRNVVLDPDFGVYYFNQNDQIASYEELCSNSELIIKPINPILGKLAPDFKKAYSEETAEMYASTEDNLILNTRFSDLNNSEDAAFVVPSGAMLRFPVIPKINPFRWTFIKIFLPAGVVGNVCTPLVPAAIVGRCEFVLNDKEFQVDKFLYSDLQNLQVGKLEIVENYEGVEIHYFVNPKIFCNDDDYLLELRTIYGKTPEVKQFEKSNSICKIIEIDLLDSCLNANLQKSFSRENDISFDDRFDSFIRFCETDSVISDYFLWDSLRSDYEQLVAISNNNNYDKLEDVRTELLRRFFARRFILETYFSE
jgi:hypothetical protein